ncbi:dihydrofolate synthase / folylpolyglutamate synthase [Clostridium sp. USBA 49]|jgi:dihydrofolate synthase/folylpolyglutamate synthase|uniref:bifunctional folylpolyglutamate synthase/dihydrofolate synthase n=1 Tax=Clostridium TaxID=1485 RepID=UPI000998F522|nr:MULTISPECIES: folylpolyglutamate synthase/dihydrofolate synthase family protein [Clostridium]SKA83776.1 dihydrofolate synthase / folylpolyglutamate synthase [Clostridium sp. USBA 49]
MNYIESMSYIKNTAKLGSNYGLERTEKILEILGNPHKKLKCIHIAGTNGKGSTTVMISEILKEAGYKVGMYISPYLEEFEERIQINSENISKEDLAKVVTEVAKAVDKVISLGYEHPTEFEIISCAMFKYFYDKNVDYAVIEVGLGGRLDSTNVIIPILSIITSISYDHMKILGDTLGKIAYEKAGIIKNEVPLVLYPQEEESYNVIKNICTEKNSKLIDVKRNTAELKYIDFNNFKQNIIIKTNENYYEVEFNLLGKHQMLNCSVVIHAVEELIRQGINIEKQHILKALKNVKWPGRLEVMKKDPLVVIDGAHNVDGIKNLKESIDVYFKYNNIILILGILADKQVGNMINIIAPKAAKIIVTAPHSERAETSKKLAYNIKKINPNVEIEDDYEKAYKLGLSYCQKDDLLLICGSLYMIGDMRKIIKNAY